MLNWGPAIYIDGSGLATKNARSRYEKSVYQTLDRVVGVGKPYSAGHAVLISIAQSGKQVWIFPLKDLTKVQAIASKKGLFFYPTTWRKLDSQPGGALPAGLSITEDLERIPLDRFLFVDYPSDPGNKYVDPDEVLVHELMHMARIIRGIDKKIAMEDGYHNQEEFFSVLVENIYRSERGRPIRASQEKFRILNMDAQTFYLRYAYQIDKLCEQMPELTDQLANIKCRFNPLRVRKRYL